MSSSPVRGRALEALRSVGLSPRGLRPSAYPKAMPALIELGYVEKHQARWEGAKEGDMGLFLTPSGSDLLSVLGRGDFGER